jgi:GNAT superfamily N-acetyltransferase
MQGRLDDGLVLRSLSEGYTTDRENLPRFYMDVFGEDGDSDSPMYGSWTRDLMSEKHPTMTHDDLWVVVDPAYDDRIVSALLLIPQQWRYEEIEFGVGRVELVATHKDYRQRGLVRALITAAHERSANLGHSVQAITGIGHYYRRFGYAMAVDLGTRAVLALDAIPKLPDGEAPRYTLRPAAKADIPALAAWDEYTARHFSLYAVRSERAWRFDLVERSEGTPFSMKVWVIVNNRSEDVGYVAAYMDETRPSLTCLSYVVGEKSSYLDTFEDVLRALRDNSEAHYKEKTEPQPPPSRIYFSSDLSLALDLLIRSTSSGKVQESLYAWYLRVPDIAGFIRQIAPVLERRLNGSAAHRYNGDLNINFYDLTGLTITFEEGRITSATASRMEENNADIRFPYHLFLNVLFGHRTPDEIRHIMPEVYYNRKAAVLMDAMFPRSRACLFAQT